AVHVLVLPRADPDRGIRGRWLACIPVRADHHDPPVGAAATARHRRDRLSQAACAAAVHRVARPGPAGLPSTGRLYRAPRLHHRKQPSRVGRPSPHSAVVWAVPGRRAAADRRRSGDQARRHLANEPPLGATERNTLDQCTQLPSGAAGEGAPDRALCGGFLLAAPDLGQPDGAARQRPCRDARGAAASRLRNRHLVNTARPWPTCRPGRQQQDMAAAARAAAGPPHSGPASPPRPPARHPPDKETEPAMIPRMLVPLARTAQLLSIRRMTVTAVTAATIAVTTGGGAAAASGAHPQAGHAPGGMLRAGHSVGGFWP